jgi:hypothetical protein
MIRTQPIQSGVDAGRQQHPIGCVVDRSVCSSTSAMGRGKRAVARRRSATLERAIVKM